MLGIEPIRSSQPRWPMKYARFGFDAAMFIAKSIRKMTQIALSYRVRSWRVSGSSGSSSRTMIASEKIVRTRMKML